jgi:hypothetical protein
MKAYRIGEINHNLYGSEMVIEEYHSASDVIVLFDTGNLVHTSYARFKNGNVKNPFDPRVCEVGYLGEGIHKASENGKATRVYATWNSMLNRAYNKKYHDRQPTYKDVTVCREWHCFQNFADWYVENYYQIDGEIMSMDKDILVKGNKLYSPETCVFVPERLNSLIVKCDGSRGELPVGVAFNKQHKKYQSQCSNGKGEIITLGRYDTPDEAFLAYKIHKERVIKDVANEYKGKIPKKLYDVLINWKVEIDD